MIPILNRSVYNRPLITDHSKQSTFITDHNKIISCDPTISVIRLFSVVGCFVLFCRPVSVFVECRWLISIRKLQPFCWNAVTSVKNISSCGPQKSTVIVSFLWSTVWCLLRTDHNKKVKPPVSHAPISKETVFRKIHFILAYAETIKLFSKWVIYLLCCFCTPHLFFVLRNRSCSQTIPQKGPMFCFCLNIAQRPLW